MLCQYLVSLGYRVLDACGGLHVVCHSLVHWGWGQNPVLEALRVCWEPTLLRRKDRFLILQTALHYELILRGYRALQKSNKAQESYTTA